MHRNGESSRAQCTSSSVQADGCHWGTDIERGRTSRIPTEVLKSIRLRRDHGHAPGTRTVRLMQAPRSVIARGCVEAIIHPFAASGGEWGSCMETAVNAWKGSDLLRDRSDGSGCWGLAQGERVEGRGPCWECTVCDKGVDGEIKSVQAGMPRGRRRTSVGS
jgi:hypothetical protein